jgi:hypothetical protein
VRIAVEGRQECNEGQICCRSGEGKGIMGRSVTYGGMPPFFVFRGQRIFKGYYPFWEASGQEIVREKNGDACPVVF